MSTTALGIMQDSDGKGTSPHSLRKIIQARWSSIGVITGLDVSGGSDLTYNVAAGCAVLSRSDSDGCTEAYWEGGSTDAVSVGDPSNARIDVIWMKANDIQQGDGDNHVTIGVTEGQPAATPSRPSLPSGCTALACMRMPAGATSTSSARLEERGDYAIPYGASSGVVAQDVDTSSGTFNVPYVPCTGSFFLPTDRLVAFAITITAGVVSGGPYADGDGSLYCRLSMDGQIIDNREIRVRRADNAVSNFYQVFKNADAGNHTFELRFYGGMGDQYRKWWSQNGWAGQQVIVVDMGVGA